jgi:hypothetical protein
MTLEARIISLAEAIGTDVKTLTTKQGDLTALTTTAKTNLVAAINEIAALVGDAGVAIDDTATDGNATVTWSADKIFDAIAAAKTEVTDSLTNGASAALDTLSELAAALGNDSNFSTTIAAALTNRVRIDEAQTLTTAQQAQACANIGVGDNGHDYLVEYAAAKA